MGAESPVQTRVERDGALLRLSLARPKANLVDAAMIMALHGALIEYRKTTTLRGVLLAPASRNTCPTSAPRCWARCMR